MGLFKDNLNKLGYMTEAEDIPASEGSAAQEKEKEVDSKINNADFGSNLLSHRPILAKAAVMLVRKIKGAIVSPVIMLVNGKECAYIESEKKRILLHYNNSNIIAYVYEPKEGMSVENIKTDKIQTSELGLTAFIEKLLEIIGETKEVNESLKDDRVAQLTQLVPDIALRLQSVSRLGLCKQLMQDPRIYNLYGGKIANLNQDIMDRIQPTAPGVSGGSAPSIPSAPAPSATGMPAAPAVPAGLNIVNNVSIAPTEEELDEKIEEAIEIYEREYDEDLATIAGVTKDMCDAVRGKKMLDAQGKETGEIGKRLMIICGAPGVGKTYTLEQTLKDEKMVEGRDYIKPSSFAISPTSLYKLFYDYQDKLIILDDVSRIFDSAQKISFWQASVHGTKGNVSKMGAVPTYKKTYNRKENYYNEVGDTDASLRLNTRYQSLQKDIAKLQLKHQEGQGTEATMKELESKQRQANDLRNKVASDLKPKMPDNFDFRGCVIIITNASMDDLKSEIGGDYWNSILDRASIFNIYPHAKIIWRKIKNVYQKEMDNSEVPDEITVVPRNRWAEVVKAIEDRLTGKVKAGNIAGFNRFSWRVVPNIGKIMRRGKPDYEWIKYLNGAMSTDITDVNKDKKAYLSYMVEF